MADRDGASHSSIAPRTSFAGSALLPWFLPTSCLVAALIPNR